MSYNEPHSEVTTPKQNDIDVRRSRRNRRPSVSKNKKRSTSHARQRKFPKHFTFSPPHYRNNPKTSPNLPLSKRCVSSVRSLRRQKHVYSESSSEYENLSTFHEKWKLQARSSVQENKKRSISHKKQQTFPRSFASSPCSLRYRNHPATSLQAPMSKQSVSGVRPLWEQSNVRVERVSEQENVPIFHSNSTFCASSNPSLYIPVAFNDPRSHCYKIKGCWENSFQTEEQLSFGVCSAITSKKAPVSSNTHMLVSNYIRNSSIPMNISKLLPSSTTSSNSSFYFRPLSFHTSHSTPKWNSAAEEIGRINTINRNINQLPVYPHLPCHISAIGITSQTSSQYSTTLNSMPKDRPAFQERNESPSSTLVGFGSMESILEDTLTSSSTADRSSLSESSRHSSELIFDVPPKSRASQISSNESWDSEDGIKSRLSLYSDYHRCEENFPYFVESWDSEDSIKSKLSLYSDYHRCKDNLPYFELVSKENYPNNTPLKNENSSEASIFPVRRQSPSQLQIDLSPSTILTSLLNEGKYIENPTGSLGRYFPDSAILYYSPVIKPSNDSKARNSFKESVRMYPTLDSKYSLKMPSLYPEEPLRQHVEKFSRTSHPSGTTSSSEESYIVENTVESVRQSFASLSMTCIPPRTDATTITVASNEPNSDKISRTRNKTRKKWKLISCFTACFHLFTPKQKCQSCNFRESYIRK